MSDVQKRLDTARTKVEKAKTDRIRLEAQLEQVVSRRDDLLGQLAKVGIEDGDAARARVASLDAEIESVLDEVERKLA